jgi:Zn-dependent protease
VLWSLAEGYLPEVFPDADRGRLWLAGIAGTVLFFASVVIHELSHSLTARALGVEVVEITLFVFGGVSRLASEAKDAWTEIKIAAVGPLASFCLAATFLTLSTFAGGDPSGPTLTGEILNYLGLVNLALGVFNLLPGFPLDGGRVLRAFWWLVTGSPTRATRVATRWGVGVALFLIAYGVAQMVWLRNLGGLWMVLLGLFLRSAASASGRDLLLRSRLEGARVSDAMLGTASGIASDLSLERAVADYFLPRGLEAFPVVRDDRICGIVSLDAVRAFPVDERVNASVQAAMTPLDLTAATRPDQLLAVALERMVHAGERWLPVVAETSTVGVLTRGSVSRFLQLRPDVGAVRDAAGG